MSDDTVESTQNPSPGQYLRNARQAKQWDIDQVARKVKLSAYIIDALEADDYAKMEGAVFVKGYLRLYANVLDVNQHTVIDYFHQLTNVQTYDHIADVEHKPKQNDVTILNSRRICVHWLSSSVLLSVFILAGVIGYVYYHRVTVAQASAVESIAAPAAIDIMSNINANLQDVTLSVATEEQPALPASDTVQQVSVW